MGFEVIKRGARWLTLFLALYAIALSLPKFGFWPDGWQVPISRTIQSAIGVNDETVVCLALASLVLSYWGSKEGKEAASDLARITGFLSGLPWVATVSAWVVKGAAFMFKTLRRKATELIRDEALAEGRDEGRAEGRDEGRAEGRVEEAAKWQAWLERRISANPDLLDENDPPPSPPSR